MRIGVLSNIFRSYTEMKEVEEDLVEVGEGVKKALEHYGHEVIFFDVNEKTFEILRKSKIDIAFNVCERFNGNSLFEPHVAAMLELLELPYTGSGPLTLATCINKARVKEILMHHQIPTPRYQVFYSKNKKLDENMKFPLLIKPSQMDNSIGINQDAVVNNEIDLRKKVDKVIRTYNQPALVEEYIEGRDLDVGILGNGRNLVNLPIAEIEYQGFSSNQRKIFSYEAKWLKDSEIYNKIDYKYPTNIPKYLELKIKKIAADVYNVLGCRDYGRVDIRLSEDNIPYVLEMNPNPGISIDCSTPKVAKLLGLEYHEMIYKILVNALGRYNKAHLANPLKRINTTIKDRYKITNELSPPQIR
tara:strand:- start:12864 stop:13940 length:1077 start_codon:yes stop_codon:yes gene_type:complete